MRTSGSRAVRSRPSSARGDSRRVSAAHSSIIRRTSSTWLGFGSRPKPSRASEEPEVRRRPQPRRVGSQLAEPVDERAQPRGARTGERDARERREQHDALDPLGRDLGVAEQERLHRDAAHRVTDEHRVAQIEPLRRRCGRRRRGCRPRSRSRRASSCRGRGGRTRSTRNPAAGSVSSWRIHVRTESVTPCDSTIGAPVPALTTWIVPPSWLGIDRRLVDRRVEHVRGVAVGTLAQPLRDDTRRAEREPGGTRDRAGRDPGPASCDSSALTTARRGTRAARCCRRSRTGSCPGASAHSAAVTASEPCRPMSTTSSPTSTASSPMSTISWSIVTVPAIGRRRPRTSTSPPASARLRGTPSP